MTKRRRVTRNEQELINIAEAASQQTPYGPWTVKLREAQFDRLYEGLRPGWRFRSDKHKEPNFVFHGVLFLRRDW